MSATRGAMLFEFAFLRWSAEMLGVDSDDVEGVVVGTRNLMMWTRIQNVDDNDNAVKVAWAGIADQNSKKVVAEGVGVDTAAAAGVEIGQPLKEALVSAFQTLEEFRVAFSRVAPASIQRLLDPVSNGNSLVARLMNCKMTMMMKRRGLIHQVLDQEEHAAGADVLLLLLMVMMKDQNGLDVDLHSRLAYLKRGGKCFERQVD
jgi:hypothetical protein